MKVKIEVTLDVDKAQWAFAYGLDPREVRDDVQVYIRDLINYSYSAEEGLFARL